MFISSALLYLLASILPLDTRQAIDDSKYQVYEYLDASNIDSAHLVVDHAIQKADEFNYNYGKAKSIFIKSYLHRVNNELGESFILNLKALRLLREDQDTRTPKTITDLYINTGEILCKHFRFEEAIQYYDEGIAVARANDLEVREHELLYNKGIATLKSGSYQKALDLFNRSLSLSKATGDEWTILNSLNYLGLTAIELEKHNIARTYFDEMIDFDFKEESPDEYKGYAFQNIGESFQQEGENFEALNYFQKALIHNFNFGDSLRIFEVQSQIARLYYDIEAYDDAKKIALESLITYPYVIQSPDNYQIFDLLTEVSFLSGDYKSARSFHTRYIHENEAFLNLQQEVLQLSEQYKMEMLTASFFKDIEKQEQMAQLNQIIYLLLGLGLLSFIFVRAKKYLLKRSLEQAFREVAQKKNLHF